MLPDSPVFQIGNDEKFAFVVLPATNIADEISLLSLGENLWVAKELHSFGLNSHWKKWIGKIRSEDFKNASCFLISKSQTINPSVLDHENQVLSRRVCYIFDGLLVTKTPICRAPPFLMTGAKTNDEISIRGITDLRQPVFHAFNASTIMRKLQVNDFQNAVNFGSTIAKINSTKDYTRLKRSLSAFFAGIYDKRPEERLHQFCRSIDGLISSRKGHGKRDFAERTRDFIGAGHDDIMNEMYDMRSAVEHLRPAEMEVSGSDLKQKRLCVLERSLQSEAIARFALQRVLLQENLLNQFKNDQDIEDFWEQLENIRHNEWGTSMDFGKDLQGLLDPQLVTDAILGLTTSC